MASLIYNRALENLARGTIDFDTDVFKVMLVSSAYVENKDTHGFRSDVTGEISGAGYTAGGNVAVVSVALDTANDRVVITLGGVTWNAATFTPRKAIYYKSRGGAASADELIAVNDFLVDKPSSGGNFELQLSTLTIQN